MNTTVQISIPGRKPSEVAAAAAKCITAVDAASRALRSMDVRKVCRRAVALAAPLFSETACIAAMATVGIIMWLLIALDARDTTVAAAGACVLPWMAVMAVREFRNTTEEGGEL